MSVRSVASQERFAPLPADQGGRRLALRTTALPILLTLASGVLYSAAFPPLSLYPLGWLALAPFFAASARVRPLQAAGLGLLWALCAGFGTAYWMPGMLVDYFGATTLEAWAGSFAILLLLVGTYTAGFSAWLAWLVQRGKAGPLVVAAGWATCEFARVHLLLPSPWALSAYSQIEWSALIQVADTSGPFGLAFLIAWANACVAGFLVGSLRPKRAPLYLAGLAAALGAVLLYGQWRLSQPFADGEPVRVAVVQGGVSRHYLRPDERSGEHLTRHLELTQQAAALGSRLIFWPEGALDVELYPLSARSLRVFELGRAIDAELLVGGPRSQATLSGAHYFNSISLLRRGRRVATYDKVELMPFAETNPLRALLQIGTDRYSPGQGIELLPAGAFSIGTVICSEAMLPRYVRHVVDAGAEILANPSDDHWFAAESASRQQLASSAFRAIENRRYVVRATSTGYSAIIDPHGGVIARSDLGTSQVLEGYVWASDVETPYRRVGDLFAWAALAVCAAVSLRNFTTAPPLFGGHD